MNESPEKMMRDATERILRKLADRKDVSVCVSDDGARVTITPAATGGFEIALTRDRHSLCVSFDCWHEHFATVDEALDCVRWGLTPACRLKIKMRGSVPVMCTIQYLDEGEWIDECAVGFVFVPFWKRATVVYKQNDIFVAP